MNPHALVKDEKQIKALESIKRVDKEGYLYYMEMEHDYYALESLVDHLLDAGCSTFVARNPENEYIMYRNYDYRHKYHNDPNNPYSGINVVCRVSNPNAKYKSIGVADAFWLDSAKGNLIKGCLDDDTTDVSSLIMLPFLTVDGVNEAGLTVSVMALSVKADWQPIDYETYQEKLDPKKENYKLEKAGEEPDIWAPKNTVGSIAYNDIDKKAWICHKERVQTKMPGKKSVMHTVLMRKMLDTCANVEEAVALADQFNINVAMVGTDMHIMVADAKGNVKVLEWDDNQMYVVDTPYSTNFRFSSDDLFHGECPRGNVIKAGLARGAKNGLHQYYGELTMRLATQNPYAFGEGSVTQFSAIYNMAQKTLKVYSFGNYDESYTYTL